jgi:DnaJ domain
LSTDFSKAYELLGVKPGVSGKELKAAQRDLAKVWHPDRFLHDPRLQEKAQEKLKEINEAYEVLSSGKPPRPTPPPRAQQQQTSPAKKRPAPGHGFNWPLAVVSLLVFVVVFAVTTRTLLPRRSGPVDEPAAEVEAGANVAQQSSRRPDANTRAAVSDPRRKAEAEDSITGSTLPADGTTEPTPAVASVTVTIDPESGLLARTDCPLRSRMTYPSGSAPSAKCNLNHTVPPKDSRIKSFAKSVGVPWTR